MTVNRESYFEGKKLYASNCSSCHQENGQGYASIYPPLANSDYLLDNPERAVRIIKLGIDDKIIVNGKTYDFTMPAYGHLNNVEIAQIITYITNSWGTQGVNMNSADVKTALLSN
jgi:mono/diheme cytochrome c family protein